jgi:subtilisin-like proprotein convertase family protein
MGTAHIYGGDFPFDSSDVNIGDLVQYRIIAQDSSSNLNQSISGPHEFNIKFIFVANQLVNLAIPNNNMGGINDTINISGNDNLRIIDVKVRFIATHPNFGDLILKLASPQGTGLTLIDRAGYPANPLGNPGNDPDIMLDDQAAVSIEDITFGNDEQVVGFFQPDPDLLNALNEQDHRGNWTVTVIDNKPGHTGTFTGWGLHISLGPSTAINPEYQAGVPGRFYLHQNYPNPFNPTTTIRYDLREDSKVVLKIYNILGQKIHTLLEENQPAGYHSVIWDGKNSAGIAVTSGLYFIKIVAGDFSQTRKVMMLK